MKKITSILITTFISGCIIFFIASALYPNVKERYFALRYIGAWGSLIQVIMIGICVILLIIKSFTKTSKK